MNTIIVIGAGPNGIYCYKTLKNRFPNKKIFLIEKNSLVSNIKNYPNLIWHSPFDELCFDAENNNNKCYPQNKDVINYYTNYFSNHNLSFIKDTVIDIKKNNDTYNIILKNRNPIETKYVILCTGIFGNSNKLNINTHFPYVTYNYPDFHTVKNKHLVLIGGGNSSLDYIIYLLPHNKITWVLRTTYTVNSAHFRKFQNTLRNYYHNLTMYQNTIVKEFRNNNSIILSNNKIIENVDECNILIGFTCKNSLCEKIGFEYNGNNIKLNENYETNFKNIFVFGSLATQPDDVVYIHRGNPKRLNKILSVIN
tara:strand:- start:2604 stop:3530 length:927 start_codon:yes stop_codon:yes gene_type:complete